MLHCETYYKKAQTYTLKVENSIALVNYTKGSELFKEIKSAIDLSLLNICKAIMAKTRLHINSEDAKEIIYFVAERDQSSALINRILNNEMMWECSLAAGGVNIETQKLLNLIHTDLKTLLNYLKHNLGV